LRFDAPIAVMRALSIRQPYAELILRGIKTSEFRSRPTHILDERFYIYAAKGPPTRRRNLSALEEGRRIWSDDLAVPGKEPGSQPPPWMMELAELLILGKLPTGVIVGTARICACSADERAAGRFAWHLTDIERLDAPIRPARHPQPAWFRPF
jgi:hypothetical protein